MERQPFTITMAIVRKDAAKRIAYGWASIVEKDGKPVIDLQGDVIAVDELERSSIQYMQRYRDAGDMHERTGVATCVASLVTTPEVVKTLFPDALPGQIPVGWAVGFHVHDDALWKQIDAGERGALSIHGIGERHPMPEAA